MADLVVAIDARKAKQGARVWDGATDKIDRGAKKVDRSVGGVDRRMGSAGRSTGRLASAMGRLLAPMAALAAIGKTISIAAEVQATRTAFIKLVGDQERALTLFENIRTFAAETPFQFQGLAQGARLAIAMGADAEEAFKRMRVAADASAALNAGEEGIKRIIRALGQMEAKGKVSAEEMNQLAEIGIDGFGLLARATGKTSAEIRKLSERGLLDATRAVRILRREMEKDSGGTAKSLSEEVKGLFSTLRDNLTKAAGEIGEALIEAFDLKAKLRGALDFVKSFGRDMVAIIKHVSGVEGALDGAGDGARTFAHWLDRSLPVLKAFVAVRIAEMGFNAARAFFAMTTGVKTLKQALRRSGLVVLAIGLTKLAEVTGLLDTIAAKIDVFWKKVGGGPDPNAPTLSDELIAAIQTKDMGAQVSVLERIAERIVEAKEKALLGVQFDILNPGNDGSIKSIATLASQLESLGAALHNVGASGGAGSLDEALASTRDRIAELNEKRKKAAQDDIDNLLLRGGPKKSGFAGQLIDQLRQEQMALTLTADAADQYVGGLRLIEAARRDGAQNTGSLAESYRKELEQLQKIRDFRDAGEILGNGIGQGFQTAFDRILDGAKTTARDLKEIFGNIAKDIASALFQRFVINQLVDSIASGFGSLAGAPGGAAGGARSSGGAGSGARGPGGFNFGSGPGGSLDSRLRPPPGGGGNFTQNVRIIAKDPDAFQAGKRRIQRDMRKAAGR